MQFQVMLQHVVDFIHFQQAGNGIFCVGTDFPQGNDGLFMNFPLVVEYVDERRYRIPGGCAHIA